MPRLENESMALLMHALVVYDRGSRMNSPTIETDRLKLRPFTLDDLDSYSIMCGDNQFMRFLGGKTFTKRETWRNIAFMLGHWSLLGYGVWAIEHRETGELLGRAGLLNPYGWPGVELCWALAPNHWGNGYATEAAKASADWAFNDRNMNSLISLIHPENYRSEAVAKRVGETFLRLIHFRGQPTKIYQIERVT
jgi:RimJ/RimL family protein N-acetyltransferase